MAAPGARHSRAIERELPAVAAKGRVSFRHRCTTCSAVALANPAADFHSPLAFPATAWRGRRVRPVFEAGCEIPDEGGVCMGNTIILLCML